MISLLIFFFQILTPFSFARRRIDLFRITLTFPAGFQFANVLSIDAISMKNFILKISYYLSTSLTSIVFFICRDTKRPFQAPNSPELASIVSSDIGERSFGPPPPSHLFFVLPSGYYLVLWSAICDYSWRLLYGHMTALRLLLRVHSAANTSASISKFAFIEPVASWWLTGSVRALARKKKSPVCRRIPHSHAFRLPSSASPGALISSPSAAFLCHILNR